MPRNAYGRALQATLIACVLALSSACDRESGGAVEVTVIGQPPAIVDPAAGPLTPGESVLLMNVAQGLVRFDARGEIEPGLAERWNVSDDGLSYIFRISSGEWPSGRKISAHQVARILRRAIGNNSNNPLKDTLGAIEEIVAMTDRVLEIRLRAPRPNLLQLLAQPEFALVRDNEGTGPFTIAGTERATGVIRLQRRVEALDGEQGRREEVWLGGALAPHAVQAFVRGDTDLVLGGSFVDLAHVQKARIPRGALNFDPVAGLFGLAPARESGPLADPELRRLLAQAMDRDALIAALGVPGLLGRATLLEARLEGVPDPVAPVWTATPIAERRPLLVASAERLFGGAERPVIRIALPKGPGADLLLSRLAQDWGTLGLKVERAGRGHPADLKLVDLVAPSTSPAWFLRRFRCDQAPICDEETDALLDAARAAPVAAQRGALLAEAARRMDDVQVFLPIAAPIRWSLVSNRIEGFAGNRFARHTLTSLEERLNRDSAQ